MMVRKRNGKLEEFNGEKIREAIRKAFEDVYGEDLGDHRKEIALCLQLKSSRPAPTGR